MEDVALCKELGCPGVVLGFEGGVYHIDRIHTQLAVDAAGDMSVTFNRAVDTLGVFDSESLAFEGVVESRCERLLTSGGEETAEHGMEGIRDLVERAQGRISIMAGGGVTPENVKQITQHTGVREVHTSAKRVKKHLDKNQRKGLFEADEIVVDGKIVAEMVEVLNSINIKGVPSLPPAHKKRKLSTVPW